MKLLSVILMILLATPAWAFPPLIAGKSAGGAAASCSASTNEVGDRTDYSDANTSSGTNTMECYLYQSDCTSSGTFGKAYFSHHGTSSQTIKICVYTAQHSTEHSPDSGDTLVGCTTGDTVNTDGWIELTGDIGGTATASAYYWVCHVSSGTVAYHRTASGTRTAYSNGSASYASPAANLTGTWTGTASRDRSEYVVVGP